MSNHTLDDGPSRYHLHSKLCDICAALFIGLRQDKNAGDEAEIPFGQTFLDLEQSATRRLCHLCYIRWNAFDAQERNELTGCVQVSFGFWTSGGGMNFDYYYPSHVPNRKNYLSKSIIMRSPPQINWPDPDNVHRLDTSNQSASSFGIVRRWLNECDTNHRYCQIERGTALNMPLPTRLLDIRDDWIVRLVDGSTIVTNRKYMTLSHCWGGQAPLTLTRQSFGSLTSGFKKDTLPNTFKDAVTVAKRLGVNYLWIDSLCIIQDDDDDLAREISFMERVYSDSYCNIAATKAVNSQGGCFTQRHLMDVLPCKIRATWRDQPQQTFYCWVPQFWDMNIEKSTLLGRGWVMQERVLAPRVLHFAAGQIFWECLENRACETFPGGYPSSAMKPSMNPYSLRNDLIQHQDTVRQRYTVWNNVLDLYSRCLLTYPEKDKLIAISGLARKVGPSSEYIAGLWWKILPHQLMWTTSKEQPASRPLQYRAPSWSWASVDGAIFARSLSDIPASILIDILAVDVQLADRDPYGRVAGGSIKLKGPIGRFNIAYTRYQTALRTWMGKSLANVIGDTDQFPAGSTIYCLIIERHETDGSLFGIVIRPSGQRTGEYLRCGWFAFFNRSAGTEASRLGLEGTEPLRQSLDASEYEQYAELDDSNGFHNYVITLV